MFWNSCWASMCYQALLIMMLMMQEVKIKCAIILIKSLWLLTSFLVQKQRKGMNKLFAEASFCWPNTTFATTMDIDSMALVVSKILEQLRKKKMQRYWKGGRCDCRPWVLTWMRVMVWPLTTRFSRAHFRAFWLLLSLSMATATNRCSPPSSFNCWPMMIVDDEAGEPPLFPVCSCHNNVSSCFCFVERHHHHHHHYNTSLNREEVKWNLERIDGFFGPPFSFPSKIVDVLHGVPR